MRKFRRAAVALALTLAPAGAVRAADAPTLWRRTVQPLLDVQCVKCHGPIEHKGGLTLDSPENILRGGDDGAVVVPGDPDASRLFRYLAPDADQHMPPKKQLGDAERDAIRAWIAAWKPGLAPASDAAARPATFATPTEAIDSRIARGWEDAGVRPAAEVDDRTWCRRVFLDLAGRIPTHRETEEFLSDAAESRRARLVDRLLASDDYPVRMRELWDVFLMGRPKRESHEDRRRDNGWWAYLEAAFRANRGWDAIVRELLTARPADPEQRGASWFVYERRNDYQAIAEAVGPLVYGTRIDCAQCHDHPLAREVKQAHYWGLVAAFNRGKNVEGGTAIAESAIGGFANFTNLKKESQPAVIALLDGPVIDEIRPAPDTKEVDREELYRDPGASVRIPVFSRREAFARAATTGNPRLARAFVNRMWAVLLGRGFVHPADEMTARNAPSHPELLDDLARDFADHGHDIRRLLRGIVLSHAYALGPASGSAPPADLFAAALERPLTGEQIARSWSIAVGREKTDDRLRRAVSAAIPEVAPREYLATFQQAQFLTYSAEFAQLLASVTNPPASQSFSSALPPEAAGHAEADATAEATRWFRATLGRAPDRGETERLGAFLKEHADAEAGRRDLLWALLTSPEFLTTP